MPETIPSDMPINPRIEPNWEDDNLPEVFIYSIDDLSL